MAKHRRTFTPTFKIQAVKLATEQGRSVAEVARDLDLSESLLRSWKQALAHNGDQAAAGLSVTHGVRACRITVNPALAIGGEVQRGLPQKGPTRRRHSGTGYVDPRPADGRDPISPLDEPV
jgi:transposase